MSREQPRGERTGRSTRQWILLGFSLFLAVVVALQVIGGQDGFGLVEGATGDAAYAWVFVLIALDGICAIFPGETTLNAASTLAAQGVLRLGLVMVVGALGAIVGDSTLYWIARRSRRRYQPRLDRALENRRVAAAMAFVGSSAPTLLVAGRYLPGMRLVVNAMFGLQGHPYRHFLLWSSIGGTLWSIYTCALAYLIGTALLNFPLASLVISGLVTSVALAAVYFVVRRRRRAEAAGGGPDSSTDSVEQ